MANPEDIVTDDLTKNEDGQYVNKAGEVVAVDSIAYRNERLEARKRDAIDDLLGKDKSTEAVDPNTKRDNRGRSTAKASAAKKTAKAAAKTAPAKPTPAKAPAVVSTEGPTGTHSAGSASGE